MQVQSALMPVGIALVVMLRLIMLLPPMAANGEHFPRKWRLWALGEPRYGRVPKSEDFVM
jgi:hypothetical protein